MSDIMSNPSLVTQLAGSNGTTTDAIAIIKKSIPGMKSAIASDEVSDVVLNTLNADSPEIAYACIMANEGLSRFDNSTYGDLYTKIFDNATSMNFLMKKKEAVDKIFDTPSLLSKFSSSEVSLSVLSSSLIAIHCLDDNDVVKKPS